MPEVKGSDKKQRVRERKIEREKRERIREEREVKKEIRERDMTGRLLWVCRGNRGQYQQRLGWTG